MTLTNDCANGDLILKTADVTCGAGQRKVIIDAMLMILTLMDGGQSKDPYQQSQRKEIGSYER